MSLLSDFPFRNTLLKRADTDKQPSPVQGESLTAPLKNVATDAVKNLTAPLKKITIKKPRRVFPYRYIKKSSADAGTETIMTENDVAKFKGRLNTLKKWAAAASDSEKPESSAPKPKSKGPDISGLSSPPPTDFNRKNPEMDSDAWHRWAREQPSSGHRQWIKSQPWNPLDQSPNVPPHSQGRVSTEADRYVEPGLRNQNQFIQRRGYDAEKRIQDRARDYNKVHGEGEFQRVEQSREDQEKRSQEQHRQVEESSILNVISKYAPSLLPALIPILGGAAIGGMWPSGARENETAASYRKRARNRMLIGGGAGALLATPWVYDRMQQLYYAKPDEQTGAAPGK